MPNHSGGLLRLVNNIVYIKSKHLSSYKEFAVRNIQGTGASQKASAKMMPACTMTGRHDVSP